MPRSALPGKRPRGKPTGEVFLGGAASYTLRVIRGKIMRNARLACCSCSLLVFLGIGASLSLNVAAADSPRDLGAVKPLSPKDEMATFRLPRGFRAELVACEPNIVDPVAIAF